MNQELIEKNIDLVFKRAEKFASRHTQLDPGDFVTSGYLGLVEAARKFNPAKASFRTYAQRIIDGRIVDQTRSENGRAGSYKARAAHRPLVGSDFVSAQPVSEEIEKQDLVEFATKNLHGRQRMTARMLAEGMTNKEIGAAVGVSEGMIQQTVKTVVRPILKRRLKEACCE